MTWSSCAARTTGDRRDPARHGICFLVLSDGRCLDAVATALGDRPDEAPLRSWLLDQLPGGGDLEHLGYGPWLRSADETIVERYLDVRELTPDNRERFCAAARRAASRAARDPGDDPTANLLARLADMIERAERGDPPLSRSDCRVPMPPRDERTGPGWE